MPTEYLIIDDLSSSQPQLGDGFDPLVKFASPRCMSAITFNNEWKDGGLQQSAYVSEVKRTETTSGNFTVTLSGSYSKYVSGKFSANDEDSFFSQNTVFSVFVKVVTRENKVIHPQIAAGVPLASADQFRATYGAQYVAVVEYGGIINLLFRFKTTDETVKSKISTSLSLWVNVLTLELSDSFSQQGVTTEWSVQSAQLGGTVPLLLGQDLQGLKSHLESWVPTLPNHDNPVGIQTIDYTGNIPNFPFNISAGFGDEGIDNT